MDELSEKEKIQNLKTLVLDSAEENKVVLITIQGLVTHDIDNLIFSQPVDGLLWDLNRLEETSLTFMGNSKWVNDFAVAQVIRRMSARIEELSKDQEGE